MSDQSNIAFLFPGGGTHYIGMGKSIYEKYDFVKEIFEEANDILGYNQTKLCFNGDLQKLSQMNYSLPAIFTVSYAMYKVFREETGISPSYVCGHSLGEYTALACANALSFDDALEIVHHRSKLLHDAGNEHDATMMAVNKIGGDVVQQVCDQMIKQKGEVYISVINSPKQNVVSGTRNDIQQLLQLLEDKGAECTILNISTPSHCPLMIRSAKELKKELEKYTYESFDFPVLSNLTGKPYTTSDDLFGHLIDHMVKPVQWMESIRYLEMKGITHVIEIGPQAVLKNLTNFITTSIIPFAMDIDEDFETIKNLEFTSIEEEKEIIEIEEDDLEAFMKRCFVVAVSTRNRNQNMQNYERGVVESYDKLKELRTDMASKEASEVKSLAVELLTKILETKQVPKLEKNEQLSFVNGA